MLCLKYIGTKCDLHDRTAKHSEWSSSFLSCIKTHGLPTPVGAGAVNFLLVIFSDFI